MQDTLASMRQHPLLGDGEACALFKLHSSVSTEEQRAVFPPAPPGCVKVIVATNIAETSITIDDVDAVIDAGLHKEMCFNAAAGMRALAPSRISRAAATQRAGRAGRVRPGVCYHLFMRLELESMEAHATPEVLRTDLQPLCLRLLANTASRGATSTRSTGTRGG